jgi:hypothetical protein
MEEFRMKVFIFVASMMFVSWCKPSPVVPEPEEIDSDIDTFNLVPEAFDSDERKDKTPCERACDNLRNMGCDGSEGSPGPDEEFGNNDDVACEDVCERIMDEGDFSIEPECVAKAKSCEEVDECGE